MESTADAPLLDVSQYQTVSILDFANATSTKKKTNEKAKEYNDSVEIAGRLFADKIAAELRKAGMFAEVVRGATEKEALVIYGDITRYAEGNAAARLMIGLGAGSSYFDAMVSFKDNLKDSDLAVMEVDRNSWVLGGGIAAGQTVEGYMDKAAKKIAEELAKTAVSGTAPKTGN